MTTTFITLDVWQPSNIRVKVNQGEVNSRFLQVKILDKKKPFNLTGKTVIFYATKPDGNLIFNIVKQLAKRCQKTCEKEELYANIV